MGSKRKVSLNLIENWQFTMEPKKLIATIGIATTSVIAVILFIADIEKVNKLFFPEKKHISYALFFFVLLGSVLITFYVMYVLYYRERSRYKKERAERENLQILLTDSKKLSFIDDVTGISNEKKFFDDLSKRSKELFHLIFLDLDGFGRINKKHGFQRGDQIIREISQSIYLKMRRDETLYKRTAKVKTGFTSRVYRKYTGGDELIFLIKGKQYDAVGFITRLKDQLDNLSKNSMIIRGDYKIGFHAAIVPLEPEDSNDDAMDNMNKLFKHAIEELESMRVYWDKETEIEERNEGYGFIYDKARKVFKV